ncbi:MAG: hypothetical protein JW951_00940, partial [Lentisphaerae bacterium]|nr:hypothetical protein [Lentisphaerota bacterium]
MRKRDASDVLASLVAVVSDAAAVWGGFLGATWLRFDSGWIPLLRGRPDGLYVLYGGGAAAATLAMLLVFRWQGLFVRPQIGSFVNKIPRLVRSIAIGLVLTTVLAFAVQNEIEYSRLAIGLSGLTVTFLVLLERYILFRIEWNLARHSRRSNRVLILGTDAVAAHLQRTLRREAMLRSKVIGFLRTDLGEPDAGISAELVKGTVGELPAFLREHEVDQIILAGTGVPHDRIVEIILLCEHNLITFNMVPDLFR